MEIPAVTDAWEILLEQDGPPDGFFAIHKGELKMLTERDYYDAHSTIITLKQTMRKFAAEETGRKIDKTVELILEVIRNNSTSPGMGEKIHAYLDQLVTDAVRYEREISGL